MLKNKGKSMRGRFNYPKMDLEINLEISLKTDKILRGTATNIRGTGLGIFKHTFENEERTQITFERAKYLQESYDNTSEWIL